MKDYKETTCGYGAFNSKKAVMAELERLFEDITKLKLFLKSDLIKDLSTLNQELLETQLSSMKTHASILASRLKNW